MGLKFLKNDLDGNSLILVKHFGFSTEEEVQVNSFEIVVPTRSRGSILVDANKYKSALLLLYFADLTFKNYNNTSVGFHMTPEYRQIRAKETFRVLKMV